MASARDSLLSSPHGGKSFLPKNYHTSKNIVGRHDARSSVTVKTNHSGDVPHFIYEGTLMNPGRIEENLVNDPMNGKSTLCCTSFNVINGIVGAGVIGLPFAFQQQGFLPAIIGMVVIAIVTYFTMILQIEVGRTCGCFTYESVCELAFGRKGFYGLVFFMGVNSFGVCVAYICLIQLVLPPIFQPIIASFVPKIDQQYVTPEVMIFTLSTFLLLPLSLYRNIASFEKVSFLSIIVIVLMITALAVNFVSMGDEAAIRTENLDELLIDFGSQYVQGLGTLAFAFSCQQYSFLAFESLDEPTESRWSIVTAMSLIISFIFAAIFAATGYVSFGSKTQPNVLDNLDANSVTANVARVAVVLKLCCCFPLDFFVIRYSMQRFLQKFCCSSVSWNTEGGAANSTELDSRGRPIFTPIITRENVSGAGHGKDLSCFLHFALTFVLWSAVMCVSYTAMNVHGKTKGLALVLQLCGSIGAVFVGFVFPTACYLKLGIAKLQPPNCYDTMTYYFAWVVLILGVVIGILSTIVTLIDAFSPAV
eukprot:g9337.t1